MSRDLERSDDRRTGFEVDEGLIDTWIGAMRALSENADALLPGDTFKIDPDSPVTKTATTTDFVTDNDAETVDQHQVRRDQRDRVSAQPRRTRAGGKRTGSSVTRARRPSRSAVAERDPATKWQKTKAAEPNPPPE